jgi:hypothetical protein
MMLHNDKDDNAEHADYVFRIVHPRTKRMLLFEHDFIDKLTIRYIIFLDFVGGCYCEVVLRRFE